MDPDQMDLFSDQPENTTRGPRETSSTAGRQWRKPGGKPERAVEVLTEIEEGRYGVLDNTDRVVLFEDDRHVRHALDEDVVVSLITSGYVKEATARDVVGCRHGAVIRPVMPLKLTASGRTLLHRWSALKPLDNPS